MAVKKRGRPRGKAAAIPKRDPKSGKFLKAYTDEEVLAGIDAFNEIIPIRAELKKLHAIAMKALRGTITLDSGQLQLLREMYSTLSNKMVGNARAAGDEGPQEIEIKIKAPKRPS